MLVSPILWRVLDFIFGLEHVPKMLIDFFDENMLHCLSDARGIPLVFHLTPGEAADPSQREKAIASCLFTFVYFRSSSRCFLLQFDLIVINSGMDEIF